MVSSNSKHNCIESMLSLLRIIELELRKCRSNVKTKAQLHFTRNQIFLRGYDTIIFHDSQLENFADGNRRNWTNKAYL